MLVTSLYNWFYWITQMFLLMSSGACNPNTSPINTDTGSEAIVKLWQNVQLWLFQVGTDKLQLGELSIIVDLFSVITICLVPPEFILQSSSPYMRLCTVLECLTCSPMRCNNPWLKSTGSFATFRDLHHHLHFVPTHPNLDRQMPPGEFNLSLDFILWLNVLTTLYSTVL